MRVLVRPNGWSMALVLSGLLVPGVANAQAAPQGYPAQPAYPQYPQQYQQPAQPPAQPPQQPPQQAPQYQPPSAYPQQPPAPQPYAPAQGDPAQPQGYPPQYQQPQGYPQYQQPQGYPQYPAQPQGYPQYPQQPEGYPQPQPPQGYPPPGYYPPPASYPAAPVASAPAPRHRGFMALPYLGLNFPVGDAGDGYSTGFRLGGLMGGYIGPHFSINGEMSIDILNIDTPSGYDATEVLVGLTLSPLFHFGPPRVDFVVGPRLGYFVDAASLSASGSSSSDLSYTITGLAYGLNAGAFFQVGRMWVGGLLTFTAHSASEICVDDGSGEECGDVEGGEDFKVLTLNGAILF